MTKDEQHFNDACMLSEFKVTVIIFPIETGFHFRKSNYIVDWSKPPRKIDGYRLMKTCDINIWNK